MKINISIWSSDMKNCLMAILFILTNITPAMAQGEACDGEAYLTSYWNHTGGNNFYSVSVSGNILYEELPGLISSYLAGDIEYGQYTNIDLLLYALNHPTDGMRTAVINMIQKSCRLNRNLFHCDHIRLENSTHGEGYYPLFPEGTQIIINCGPALGTASRPCC